MKKILLLCLTSSLSFSSFAGAWDCDGAIESTVNKPGLEDLPATEVCLKGKDILVKSADGTPLKTEHLLYVGAHIGVPMIGYDVTYVNRKNGKPNFHIAYDRETNLQALSHGVRFGIHPKGNAFFYGGSVRGYYTNNLKGVIVTPEVGLMGTKKFVTMNVTAGLGVYKEGVNVGVTPELNVGIRLRLFRH